MWHICTDTVLNLGHELILKLRSLHFDDFSKFYRTRWFVTHIIFCSQVKLSLKKMIIRQSSFTFIYGQCLDRADWKVGYSAAGLAHSKHEDGSEKFPSWINNRFLMERGMVSTPKMIGTNFSRLSMFRWAWNTTALMTISPSFLIFISSKNFLFYSWNQTCISVVPTCHWNQTSTLNISQNLSILC